MTDPRIVAALREATGETLVMDARVVTKPEVRLNARYEPDVVLVTVTVPQDTLRRLAALAFAVAEMQEGGHAAASAGADEGESVQWVAFADGQSSVKLGPNDALAVTDWGFGNGHPTLMSALAALLEGGR